MDSLGLRTSSDAGSIQSDINMQKEMASHREAMLDAQMSNTENAEPVV